MKADLQAKLQDRAAALPLLVWLTLGIAEAVAFLFHASDAPSLEIVLRISHTAFAWLLITMILIRLPPICKSPGLLPRAAATAGLLTPLAALLLPKAHMSPMQTAFSSLTILAGTLASIVVICWLGRSFSIFPQARQLVTTGPYYWVRHPLYLSELIAVTGLAMEFEQPWALLLMLAVIGLQFPRMGYEERVLTKAFPAYHLYAQQTARLIPGLY